MTRFATPDSRTASTFSTLPSDRWLRAQQQSVKISASSCVWINQDIIGSASFTMGNYGLGLPRHRFEMVHAPFLMRPALFVFYTTVINFGRPPNYSIKSRQWAASPAIFPSTHTVYSRTSSLGDSRRFIRWGTAPFSKITLQFWCVPDDIFVNAQAASN